MSDMADPLLSLHEIRHRWPGAAADGLDIAAFELAAGEAVFLRGPSGSGKSTLLSIIAGVLAVDHGRVTLLGHPLAGLSAARRDRLRADHVGYIFQQFNLLPYLSVLDNVLLPCRFAPRRDRRAAETHGTARASAEQLLQRLGLGPDFWGREAARLSVGQQQRIAAARALIGRPELVIADEPTSALDEVLRDDFMRLLLESCAQAGSALLFVSHDARLAAHFGRRVDLPQLNRAAAQEGAA
ncbi:MAG: hypothetical protein RLY71_249 [Pseudomonadota bacterium]|jgi:putative ABC transport system ATP-binding protein